MQTIYETLKNANQILKDHNIQGQITYRQEDSFLVRCGRSQISLNSHLSNSDFKVVLQKEKKQIQGSLKCSPEESDKLNRFIKDLIPNISIMPDIDYLTEMKDIAQGGHLEEPPHAKDIDTKKMVDFYHQVDNEFGEDVELSGAFSAGTYFYALINTQVENPISYAGEDYNAEVVLQLINDDKKEIRAVDVGRDLEGFNPDPLINKLKTDYQIKTTTQREDLALENYQVIFGPEAFAELVAYMSWITFSGEGYELGRSMLQKGTHGIGDQIFGENITIIDDPLSEDTLFNKRIGLNGIERKRFPLIENGKLQNFFFSDKKVSDLVGKEVNNDFGVSSLTVSPGNGPSSFNEIKDHLEGPTLYINTLHYMNFTNLSKGEFTATSRFGTYFMAPGKEVKHLYNVRINDSFHRIFNAVKWLSQSTSHINLSNTYGMRMAKALHCPQYVLVNQVPITATSAPKH